MTTSTSCSSVAGRNVPAEAKCLKYTGSLEWGMLYVLFGRNDNDCLLAVSVSVEGPALKYFYISSSCWERN